MKLKIYTAQAISGLTPAQVQDSFKAKYAILTDYGYTVYCPMVGKTGFDPAQAFKPNGYENLPMSTEHAIFERDKWMVSQVDVVFVDFSVGEPGRVSIGSVMELAMAAQLGKHTIVVLPPGNVHDHAFVTQAADIVFETQEAAYCYLINLAVDWMGK